MEAVTRTQDYPASVNLLLLIVEELKNIKWLLLFACIFALLLGGRRGVQGMQQRQQQEQALAAQQERAAKALAMAEAAEAAAQEESELLDSDTQEEISFTSQQKEYYVSQINALEKQLERNEVQKQSSLLLNMDPDATCLAESVWYIDSHYQIVANSLLQSPDPTNRIIRAYQTCLDGEEIASYAAARVPDVSEAQIGELISVDAIESAYFLRLTVVADSIDRAEQIHVAVKEYLQSRQSEISDVVGDHELLLVKEGVGKDSGTGSQITTQAQDAFNDGQIKLLNTIADLRAKVAMIEEAQAVLLEPAQEEPAQEEPAQEEIAPISISSVIKSSVTHGLVGMILGAVLPAAYIAVRFFMQDGALSDEDIHNRYGLSILASVRRFQDTDRWQRMLSRLAGDKARVDTPADAAALARGNIASFLKASGHEGEKVILVGRESALVSDMARLISESSDEKNYVIPGGNVITDISAVDLLRDYENVVLVECKEHVTYAEIGEETEWLRQLSKNVVGLIAL